MQPLPRLFVRTLAAQTRGISEKQATSDENDRKFAIALSSILSVLAMVIVGGSAFLCFRYRYRHWRIPFIHRGVTPIDDEEIESWKAKKGEAMVEEDEKFAPRHTKHTSSSSLKKAPSVVIYQNPELARQSEERRKPLTLTLDIESGVGKKSIEIPQTPVLARAPNSRPGLTDESIQGDDAYLPSPKRQQSRLTRHPRNQSMSSIRGQGRTLSTRSSFSIAGSPRDQWYGQRYTDFDVVTSWASLDENSDRFSHPHHSVPSSPYTDDVYSHRRMYSASSIPQRSSLDDEPFGPWSPQALIHRSDIGRAIG